MGKLVPFSLLFLFACGNGELPKAKSTSGWDYNTPKSGFEVVDDTVYQLDYATGFSIQIEGENQLVTIFEDSLVVGRYLLYKEYAPAQQEGVLNIKIPIKTIACLSTTYLPYIDRLGMIQTVKGMANAQFARNENLKKQLANGTTSSISATAEIDLEKVIEIDPELLMVYPFNSPDYKRLTDLGVNLFYNTEYKEAHPLGQAEWIKLFGLLYNREAEASTIFNTIKESYLELQQLANDVNKVKVLSGAIFNGTWRTPGSNSMGAKLFEDAGGKLIWEDGKSGSYSMDIEVAIEDAEKADVMVLVSPFEGKYNMEYLVQENAKYELFKPFSDHHVVHCNTAKVNYFEDALLEPDLVLKDLLYLFHSELLPDHKLKYFRHLK